MTLKSLVPLAFVEIRFPRSEPPPLALVKRLVKARIAELRKEKP